MATCPPRQKLFETTGLSSLLLICASALLWMFILGAFCPASGEVSLDPDFPKVEQFQDISLPRRVSRDLINLDGKESKDGTNPDAYETLRQLSLASTQPFIRRRLFNTSVALTVPLFSFTLPQRAAEGSSVDLANQAIFGLFALLVVMLVFTVPVLFTGIRPFQLDGRSISDKEGTSQSILDNLMHSEHLINLMGADMRNKIGLNPDQCLQKSICDAHRHPKKYGLFALPFQIFFPPPTPGKETSRSSKYQIAAQIGEYTKSECWARYNCFFDLLDLAVYAVDWFNPPNNQEEMDANIQM